MKGTFDAEVDEVLENCVFSEPRKSFFLFAGAGSGKTHSLVVLLEKIKNRIGKELLKRRKKVAVITFTNAATNEIIKRVGYSSVFHVSTIHSFVWEVIKSYQSDIKEKYCSNLQEEISELDEKLLNSKKKTTQSYLSKVDKRDTLSKKLSKAAEVRKFIYEPNGRNPEFNALQHSEVIKISAQLIVENKSLQRIIAQQFPILLIDESQDTNKQLIDAFFEIQKNYAEIFTLGLIGDLKQRIYNDGKEKLAEIIPEDWHKPVKRMNYRSAKRIIRLANSIGKDLDRYAEQRPLDDTEEGFVRLFVVAQREGLNKNEIEVTVKQIMSTQTKDEKWCDNNAVKALTLEHMMAASRLGFADFLKPLIDVRKYSIFGIQGTLPEFEFFTKEVLPMARSLEEDGRLALEILKKSSPLLRREKSLYPYENFKACQNAAKEVKMMVRRNEPIYKLVNYIHQNNLLLVPEVLSKASSLCELNQKDNWDKELSAWAKVVSFPIDNILRYDDYLNGRSQFDTHQGVKGLEFDRVLIIIDDSEARGFLFSYDKLFGVKELSKIDLENERLGKETSVERTQRLFYVTCTRAKKSLAVVMYTTDVVTVKENAIKKGWFERSEIIEL